MTLNQSKRVPEFRKFFNFDESYIHLNNAGCSPMMIAAQQKIQECIQEQASLGYHARPLAEEKWNLSKKQIAHFVGAKPENLSIGLNCSQLISLIAQGLRLKPNDQILCWDQEYPSNVYPWLAAAKKSGAKLISLESSPNFGIAVEQLISKITKQTRVVALSWIQSFAGSVTPLKPVLDACNRVGAWLVVDVFQGLGTREFQLQDYPGMIVICGSQKWLCGPISVAFMAFEDDRYKELDVLIQGALTYGGGDWLNPNPTYVASAARFESGSGAYSSTLALAANCEVFQSYGLKRIEKEIEVLRDYLVQNLLNKSAIIYGDGDGNTNSSLSGPQLSFVPQKKIDLCIRDLQKHKISYVTKAQGIRFSPHAFNSFSELDLALSCL